MFYLDHTYFAEWMKHYVHILKRIVHFWGFVLDFNYFLNPVRRMDQVSRNTSLVFVMFTPSTLNICFKFNIIIMDAKVSIHVDVKLN